jgi:outer membrane protein OmpA-like peptidoglycan-associated protein
MTQVTAKGIWSAGLIALGAVAAFCIWQHAPSTATSPSIATSSASVTSAAVPKGMLPPAVTGPTSAQTSRMPAGDPLGSVAKTVEAPPAKAQTKVEPSKNETPKLESQTTTTVPTLEQPPRSAVKAPAVETKQTLVKAKSKRMIVANRATRGCESKRDNSVVKSICFSFNSDRLNMASKAKLNAILPTLKLGNQFELNGFADAVGSKAYNNDLSQRRNKAVLKYLALKGIDPSKLTVKSFGSDSAEKQKIGKNQRERRVDVRVVP